MGHLLFKPGLRLAICLSLFAANMLTSGCAPSNPLSDAYYSGSIPGPVYTRTIFSTNNF